MKTDVKTHMCTCVEKSTKTLDWLTHASHSQKSTAAEEELRAQFLNSNLMQISEDFDFLFS